MDGAVFANVFSAVVRSVSAASTESCGLICGKETFSNSQATVSVMRSDWVSTAHMSKQR